MTSPNPTADTDGDLSYIPSDRELHEHESALRETINRVMADASTPYTLGPHALAAGRRLRARRRISVTVGVIAAATATTVLLPNLLGGSSESRVSESAVAGQTGIEPSMRDDSSTAGPARTPWWGMPSVEMIQVATRLLPEGVTITAPGPLVADTPAGGPARGYILPVVTGPSGTGVLNMMLYPDEVPTGSAHVGIPTEGPGSPDMEAELAGQIDGHISCPGNLAPRAQCTELRSDDGTLLGRRSTSTFGDVVTHEVVLRRDGGTVYAAIANTLDTKWGRHSSVSSEAPPLSLDQLEAIVRNDAWVM